MSVVGTSSQNPRFSPPDVPGLMLWLDAADSRTVTFTGSNVSRWADKSGNGYTMDTAPSGCSLPIQGTAINGLSTVGINTLSCGIKQSRIINGITNFFWVRREVEGNQFYFGADGSYDFHTGNSQEYASLAYSPVGLQDASMTIYLSNSVVRGRMAYTPLVGVGNINLLCVSNITGETKLQGLSYDRGNTFRSQRCDWGEILLYSNALTRTQIDAVEGYLARRWGIPTYLTVTHPYRSIAPALRGFSPLDVGTCSLWLDAADPSTLTVSGSNVTAWADKSGNGRNASAVSTGPVLSNSGLVFTGAGVFQGSNATYLHNSSTGEWTVCAVFTASTTSIGNPRIFNYQGSPGNIAQFLYIEGGRLTSYVWSTPPVQVTGSTIVSNTQYLATVVNAAASTVQYVNATMSVSNSHGTLPTTSNTNYYIGGFDTGTSDRFYGTINEVLCFSNALPESQRQQVEAYLAAKWGQRGSMGGSAHPFRYGPAAIVPTSIPGCALWLDAADATSIDLSGTMVTTWRDKSGSNNTAQRTLGTPILQTLDGRQGVYFATSSEQLTTVSNASPLGSGARSLFCVVRTPTGTSQVLLGYGSHTVVASPNSFGVHVETPSTRLFAPYVYSADNNIISLSNANPMIVYADYDASANTISGSYNGLTLQTRSTATPSTTATPWYLGRRPDGNGATTGYIHEIIHYRSKLSVAERQQVEGYLAWKWGLSSNLPGVSPNYARLYRALTPVFSPLHTAPCSFWLDGADQTSMTLSGSNVTQWNDKSGSGFNAVVSSNAYATLTTTGLSFNNSYYTTNYSASPANETFFTVFTTPGTLVAASNGLVGTQTGGRTILVPGWGPNSNAFGMNNSGVAGGAGVTGLVTNTRYIGVIQITGTSTTAAINGNSPSAPVTITAFTGGRTTTIGRETSTQYAFNGIIHELLAYTASLTTAQRQQVEGYLAWKWGLQGLLGGSPHPFKYGPWLGRPTAISGCALWLDATDSTTLFQDTAGTSPVTTTGQTLRRWNDKSGRGCNATQAGNAPTWNSAGYTTFTRTSAQNLRLPDGTLPYSAVNTAYSMFAVVRPTVSSAILTILCSGSQGTNQFNGLQIQSDGRLMNIWFNNDVGGGSVPQNVFSIASAVYTGSSRSVFLTGSTVNTTASSGWAGTISNNVIGMESSTNNHAFGGDIGELIVYPTALSTTERQQIEGYLAWKWGRSATLPGASYHPYRAIKP